MTMPKAARAAVIALAGATAIGGAWALTHDEADAATQTTDDAYVQADYSTVGPRIAGTIAKVFVKDNQRVRAGDLLALIDDRDQRVALASAQADQASAKARVARLRSALTRQAKLIDQAAAAIDADRAAIDLSDANAKRYRNLASDGSASQQEQQESASRLAGDLAAERRDTASHGAAQAQVSVLKADLADAQGVLAKADAAVHAAELNLSYTRILAPVDGVVGRRTVRVGNYVAVGEPLLAVVPVRDAYIEARSRETQLRAIRPGQPATIAIDMLPGVSLRGHVASIAPATGATFGEIAPENASGNFTKITQRLAVRIAIDPGQPDAARLRVGMSAIPAVETYRP